MVFENLTLFEIQLDGAQFGPRMMHDDEAEAADVEEMGDGSRGRFIPALVLAGVVIGLAALYRRSRSTDVELDAESADAESDLAAAQ